MEPMRFLSMPNTRAANKIIGRYGASVVKSDAGTGIKGDTYVIGYPLQLVSSTKVNDKTVTPWSRPGGTILRSCKRSIRCSNNGRRIPRR